MTTVGSSPVRADAVGKVTGGARYTAEHVGPLRTDLRIWAFAAVSVVVLAAATGLPPALRAMRLKIVDALAGR